MIQGTKHLVDHATNFYKELFGPNDGFNCRLRNNVWSDRDKLSAEDNIDLSKPFSEEEVKRVMGATRSNGFLLNFIRLASILLKMISRRVSMIFMLGGWT